MTINGWLQILLFLVLVFLVTKPMGVFMTRVFNREKTFMDPVLRPVERLLYRVTGVDEDHEMRWTEYAISMLLFSLVSMIVLYLMQRLQGLSAVQSAEVRSRQSRARCLQYGGFVHDEYELAGLFGRKHDELLHPDGRPRLSQFCFCRCGYRARDCFHSRHRPPPDADDRKLLGRFGSQSLWVLLPFCVVGALVLVSQGVVQNLRPYDTAKLVEPMQVQKVGPDGKPLVDTQGKPVMDTVTEQTIAQGPVASQEIIKELGTERRRLLQCQQCASV